MSARGSDIFKREVIASREALNRMAARHRVEIDQLRKHGRALCAYLETLGRNQKCSEAITRDARRAIEEFTQD